MKKFFLLISTALLFANLTYAQPWHKVPTPEEEEFRLNHPRTGERDASKTTAFTAVMPPDARFPAEFEESQAALVSWTYNWNGTVDVSSASSYARVCAELADAIQKEVPVYIRVDNYNDTAAVKTFMTNRGTPLTNYRFYIQLGDDFWMRDYGPLGFYYSGDDSIGLLDMHYYTGRPNDDAYAQWIGDQLGYPNVRTELFAEGGNYMTDGFGTSFHSKKIVTVNSAAVHVPQWDSLQARDTIKYYWASNRVVETAPLSCDGGTKHIDMYLKLMDEQTLAIMEYPAVVTASDNATIQSVITMLSNLQSTYNRPYRIFKMPMPTKDDGTYRTSCSSINSDARTYVNGLTLNKTYIMPVYSDVTDGNKAGDSAGIAAMRRTLPGYKIVPIDSRMLTTLGGALHCITMQIPAENPVRFWHPAITDLQPLSNNFHLVAKITNKSGISASQAKWRKRGTTSWNTVNLTDSSGFKIGDISGSFTNSDVIEYYITATSNNGKTMAKPITAPEGFYTFYFDVAASTPILDPNRNFALNPLPNPSGGTFDIPVSFENPVNVKAVITDVLGKKILDRDFGRMNSGMSKLTFDLSDRPAGIYFIQVIANGFLLDTKKLVKE